MLLAYQQSTIDAGTLSCVSASRCAGSTASSSAHHQRVGAMRSAPNTSAFGSHSTARGNGENVSAKPIFAPTKYKRPTAIARKKASFGVCGPAAGRSAVSSPLEPSQAKGFAGPGAVLASLFLNHVRD